VKYQPGLLTAQAGQFAKARRACRGDQQPLCEARPNGREPVPWGVPQQCSLFLHGDKPGQVLRAAAEFFWLPRPNLGQHSLWCS